MLEKNLKLEDFIPKKDTQQEIFLQKYPEFDGRGLLIAIIDDGIDVSLPGMQKTSTGLPKIIDSFDFSGNGTIDTSIVKKFDENNILIGLSGRKLKIPSSWKNPSEKWHLGSKSMYDLCFGKAKSKNEIRATDLIMIKKEKAAEFSQKDTVLDCIVWSDGQKWQACCDTSFGENLESLKVLTNYRDEHEFGFLLDDISYCVTISSDGNLLEVIVCNHNHGTVVAHTAAAYFPGEFDHRNGLAPGAQIVSMNILSSFKKYADLTKKALLKCIEMGVDIVNLSIGYMEMHETLVNEMVEKHGIIFVKSAGNSGPDYSSITQAVEGYCDKMLFIGASITSEIMNNLCNINIEHNELSTTLCKFSSKGPMKNGSRGISFTAPGVAIASLPKWMLKENETCWGTSISAPIISGSIACLISALKAYSIVYSPAMIKLALSNTAFLPEGGDKLGFGNGVIQINDTFEYFKTAFKNTLFKNSSIKLSLNDTKKCGIYFVKTDHWDTVEEYCVKMDCLDSSTTNKSYVIKLEPQDAETWIQYSKTTINDSFNVKIDTSLLNLGSLNYAELHGHDLANPSIGGLFYFPITILYPEELTSKSNFTIVKNEVALKPGIPYRHFIIPNEILQKCIVTITALEDIPAELYISYPYSKKSFKPISFTSKGQSQSCLFVIDCNKMCEINICYNNLQKSKILQNIFKFNLEISFKMLFKGESVMDN